MNWLLSNKKKLIFAVFLFFITLIFLLTFLGGKKEQKEMGNAPSAQENTTQKTLLPSPTEDPAIKGITRPLTDVETRAMVEELKNRLPLTDDVIRKRDAIINNVGTVDIVFLSKNVKINYDKLSDVFNAIILTNDITAGREDAFYFFEKNGINKSDSCDLPLVFYKMDPLRYYACPYKKEFSEESSY
ncbi:MAG: hypothetical protein A2152_02985 [Candidatus Levybacteria bacterium RBG_16_35_6]|nr:MAG: hypothetical protein A2152_02985 [Candidatus Levybacteria bacterium RBG_16_35_6]